MAMRVVYRDARVGSVVSSGSATYTNVPSAPMSAKLPGDKAVVQSSSASNASHRAPTPAAAGSAYAHYTTLTPGSRSSVSVPPPGTRQSPLQRFVTQGPAGPSSPATSREVVATASTAAPAAGSCYSPNKESRSSIPKTPNAIPSDPGMSVPSCWASTLELNAEEPLLGGGAFAKILLVAERSSGAQHAIKVMNRPNFAIRGIEAQLDAEIDAMRRCARSRQCRHVVRLYETAEENNHVYLRLELCQCDLLRYANNQPNMRLPETDTMDFTRQLLVGLRDLHGLGILHRDVKPENLLITADGVLKIADFGWCADLNDAPSSLAGTFQYMAPEILGSLGVQTEACDVWSSGVTIIQLATGRPLLTTYLGPGATGISNTDPHQATKVKTSQLLEEIHQKCPLTEELRPADISWRCWDCLREMLVPEVAQRKSVDGALSHCWLETSVPDGAAPDVLSAQLDECPSSTSLMVPLNATPAPGHSKSGPGSSASSGSESTPRLEVPTPPCARTPVKLSVSAPRGPAPALPGSAPALPGSAPAPRSAQALPGVQVAKLIVSGTPQPTPLPTPKPTPKHTPHATPVRHVGGEFVRCRRSETAPSPLPLQAEAPPLPGTSRAPATEPPSPCASSRTPMSRTPVASRVTRAQTSASDVRSSILDQTIHTMESLDELNFRHPALQECEQRMASMVRQLEGRGREHEGHSRGSSVGVRYEHRIKEAGTVPDLRTFTELVRNCGQHMRRASTAVGEELSCRRTSYELRQPHEVARSVTLKPRCRRRAESPLRATVPASIGSLPKSGASTLSTNCSIAAPSAVSTACSVSVPCTPAPMMSVSALSGISLKTDPLIRTMPADMIQMTNDLAKTGTPSCPPQSRLDGEGGPADAEASTDKLARTAVVRARPLSYSVSVSSKPQQSARASGYPITTSTSTTTVDRLSPRPYLANSGRSPVVPLRASPPATPSPDTYRDVMLARCATIPSVSVPIAVPAL